MASGCHARRRRVFEQVAREQDNIDQGSHRQQSAQLQPGHQAEQPGGDRQQHDGNQVGLRLLETAGKAGHRQHDGGEEGGKQDHQPKDLDHQGERQPLREQLRVQTRTAHGDRHRRQIHQGRQDGHREDGHVLGDQQRHPRNRGGNQRLQRTPLAFPRRQVDGRIDGSRNRHQDQHEGHQRGQGEWRGPARCHGFELDRGRHTGRQSRPRQTHSQRRVIDRSQPIFHDVHRPLTGG